MANGWRRGGIGFLLLLTTAAAPPRAIDLPGARLFPESVATGPGRIAYVASAIGGVQRVTLRSGKVEQWVQPGAFGSGAQFGVFVDPKHRLVWTCTNDFTARGVTVPGADPGTWVKAFDLATGEGRVSLKLPGEHPVCNDFALGRDGSIYVTDTAAPRILRWRPQAQALEVWVEDPALGAVPGGGGLDGIAVAGDGNVYVNNVRTNALFRVGVRPDGSAGTVTPIALSRPLGTPDGMRAAGGMRLVVAEQEGRIAAIDLGGDRGEVRTLAEGIVAPTGVAVDGRTVWYVQAYLGALFGREGAAQPTQPFRLTAAPLAH